MKRVLVLAGAAVLLGGCAEDAPSGNAAAEAPATLQPGQYEVTATVSAFRSTDGQTPVIAAKAGDTTTLRACIGEDGAPPAELFTPAGLACKAANTYARGGRLNLQLQCTTRSGSKGPISGDVSGSFTRDGLTAQAVLASYLPGSGDFELRQELVGRRVGACAG